MLTRWTRSLAVFFAELEDRIRLLEQLSLEGDLRIILREAHSLKGTAGTFGLRRLAEYGAELEREARNLDATEYRRTAGPHGHHVRSEPPCASSDFDFGCVTGNLLRSVNARSRRR